jgi:hypothetical protein
VVLNDLNPYDHMRCVIESFVKQLDGEKLKFEWAARGDRQAGLRSRALLKLYLYGDQGEREACVTMLSRILSRTLVRRLDN